MLARLVVTGKVQGVGFRVTTKHYAERLGIKGTVRNLTDGSVEIYALAGEDTIKKLVHSLVQEFAVDSTNLFIEEIKGPQEYKKFDIL